MREIKFRGWFYSGMDEDVKPFMANIANIRFDEFNGAIVQTDEDDNEWFVKDECYLMQFTGLEDKNGKEIYEGDIVEYFIRKRRYMGSIAYATTGFWIVGQLDRLNWVEHWKISIIGNIYENGDLLK